MSGCIFCGIVRKTTPCSIVYEDDSVLAFLDTKPITQGHMLVVPKKHFELLTETDNDIASKMMVVAKTLGKALKISKLRCRGVSYLLSDGSAAGQEIYHVHLHVIPRYSGDGFYIHMPEGREEAANPEDLERIAAKIIAKLEKQ